MKPSKKNSAVQISHPEKAFWPEEGYTKGDLANFYREVFPWLQPYCRGRILTMERCPDLGFESYDRFFPSQDTMPAGGFGNLIALPLQRRFRELGNSVFLDERFAPHTDQW